MPDLPKSVAKKYRIGQWLDTSEEAMNKPQATILYGVRIKPAPGAKWMHCYRGQKPLIYDTPEKASTAIAELRAADAARRGNEAIRS